MTDRTESRESRSRAPGLLVLGTLIGALGLAMLANGSDGEVLLGSVLTLVGVLMVGAGLVGVAVTPKR